MNTRYVLGRILLWVTVVAVVAALSWALEPAFGPAWGDCPPQAPGCFR